MTAEIAVMNRNAVALAADSAVTVQRGHSGKAFNTANKLFTLSKYEPVAIMVYGGASLDGIPWETIVKIYRRQLGTKFFGTLSEYATDFLTYLNGGGISFPNSVSEDTLEGLVSGLASQVVRRLDEAVKAEFRKHGPVSRRRVAVLRRRAIREQHEHMLALPLLDALPPDFGAKLVQTHEALLLRRLRHVFQKHRLTKDNLARLLAMVAEGLNRRFFPADETGIVVAGFGRDDVFPSLRSFAVGDVIAGQVRYMADQKVDITHKASAAIVPFAQKEEVETYIEGVSPGVLRQFEGFLAIVRDKYPEAISSMLQAAGQQGLSATVLEEIGRIIYEKAREGLQSYVHREHVAPTLETVAVLSKDQVGEMAEALVNLTSFRRQFSMDLETVGGPVDVAVITKGDGFVWIKRKLYFDGKLNHAFFANYYATP